MVFGAEYSASGGANNIHYRNIVLNIKLIIKIVNYIL